MRAAGGRDKGNNFERETCKLLSLWLSYGERKDLLVRNIGSGGAFTRSEAKAVVMGSPGDVMAVDAVAKAFTDLWMVECKHWHDLGLEFALWKRTGDFIRILGKAEDQARRSGRHYFVIARQNHRPTLVFLPHVRATALKLASLVSYHGLWSGTVFGCLFQDLLAVDPKYLLQPVIPNASTARKLNPR